MNMIDKIKNIPTGNVIQVFFSEGRSSYGIRKNDCLYLRIEYITSFGEWVQSNCRIDEDQLDVDIIDQVIDHGKVHEDLMPF